MKNTTNGTTNVERLLEIDRLLETAGQTSKPYEQIKRLMLIIPLFRQILDSLNARVCAQQEIIDELKKKLGDS